MKRQPLTMIFLLLAGSLLAQNYFKIQVGTFLNAKQSDFEGLQSIGFVHATEAQGDLYTVLVGGYDDRAAAERALSEVRNEGYANAFIQEISPSAGQSIAIIQLATKSAQRDIDWETYTRVGELYALIEGSTVKVTTAPFPSLDAARLELNNIRAMGYEDAFAKSINSIYLHRITQFETGLKSEYIPLTLDNRPSNPDITPYGDTGLGRRSPNEATPRTVAAPALPRIRTGVKRRSVLELQKVLKAKGFYKSSLDGYYGDGTSSAYETMLDNNRKLQKYMILAEYMESPMQFGTESRLQQAINDLPTDQDAERFVQSSARPVAQAYQAYLLYTSAGPNDRVNDLMNSAIRGAFVGKRFASPPPFDYRATYAYDNLEQLLLHIHYIHSAPGNEVAAPCWLFERHPREMTQVFERYASVATPDFPMQACDQFLSWPEVRLTQAIALDLNPDEALDQQKLAQGASLRALLFLTPQPLSNTDASDLDNWNNRLMTGLNGWAERDPMHEDIVTAFKVAYFQSQVRLEDYFMDKGFDEREAKPLALATLRTIVGYHLERFV